MIKNTLLLIVTNTFLLTASHIHQAHLLESTFHLWLHELTRLHLLHLGLCCYALRNLLGLVLFDKVHDLQVLLLPFLPARMDLVQLDAALISLPISHPLPLIILLLFLVVDLLDLLEQGVHLLHQFLEAGGGFLGIG